MPVQIFQHTFVSVVRYDDRVQVSVAQAINLRNLGPIFLQCLALQNTEMKMNATVLEKPRN
jgi:hypothetical protein